MTEAVVKFPPKNSWMTKSSKIVIGTVFEYKERNRFLKKINRANFDNSGSQRMKNLKIGVYD